MNHLEQRRIYLVLQRHWRIVYQEPVEEDDPRKDVLPSPELDDRRVLVEYRREPNDLGIPIRGFRDPARAEAFRRVQENARRAWTNPFRYGDFMSDRTSLDEGRLRDWLLDGSLDPPAIQGEEKLGVIVRNWEKWWLKLRAKIRADLLQAFVREMNLMLAKFDRPRGIGSDLGWLDSLFCSMDQFSSEERRQIRLALWRTGHWDQPTRRGERCETTISEYWIAWWERTSPQMTELQHHHLWSAMDRLRFFDVVEMDSSNE